VRVKAGPGAPGTIRYTTSPARARGDADRAPLLGSLVQAIGAIRVSHDLGAFSDERVRLLKTFAAQSVIAIENVRLFSELQAGTTALRLSSTS
jgi:GAF domain-containing protein